MEVLGVFLLYGLWRSLMSFSDLVLIGSVSTDVFQFYCYCTCRD